MIGMDLLMQKLARCFQPEAVLDQPAPESNKCAECENLLSILRVARKWGVDSQDFDGHHSLMTAKLIDETLAQHSK